MLTIASMLLVAVSSLHFQEAFADDCYIGNSTNYDGNRDYTVSGKTCQQWGVTEPHMYRHMPNDGDHNYCRNPDNDVKGTWCYTTDVDTRWEYCNIPECIEPKKIDENYIIWTSHNTSTEVSKLLRVDAELKNVKKILNTEGRLNLTVLPGSNITDAEYWSIAGDYKNERLYFVDIRLNYIGVRDMKTGNVEKHYEGKSKGIETIAVDPNTNNIYWTDSTFKWVMATDETFTYSTPVYKTAPDKPYGLAVHSRKRLLIFSTYKTIGAKIIVTDLAGQNAKVLFKYPELFDVTGIAIDYAEDKIYWTDFNGFGSTIQSSFLNGTGKTRLDSRRGVYWGIALFKNYIYISDVNKNARDNYYLYILDKNTNIMNRYTFKEKPRGVITYSSDAQPLSSYTSTSIGDCENSGIKCEQLCFPRLNAPKVCACTTGTYLDEASGTCHDRSLEDDYLLIVDAGQGKIFQMPILPSKDAIYYNTVQIDGFSKPGAIAVAQNSDMFYWSDSESQSLKASPMNGSSQTLISSTYANSIVVDPFTGNLFYSTGENGTIVLSKKYGNLTKTIVETETGITIRMITQDIKYKYIYWTAGTSKHAQGQVLRCRYDGSEKEVVLDKMDWPHAITIDYKRNRLYVVESQASFMYEIDLTALVKINSTAARQNNYRAHFLSRYLPPNGYLIDFKIHGDFGYLVDERTNGFGRFNPTEGAASYTSYGPAEFDRLTSISAFSRSYFDQYINSQSDPCKETECSEFCIAMSETDSKCTCKDGWAAYRNECN